LTVRKLGNAGENQNRGELGGDNIGLVDAKVIERELIELSRSRDAFYPNAQGEFWRIEISHFSDLQAINAS